MNGYIITAVYTLVVFYALTQLDHWVKALFKHKAPRFILDIIFILASLMPLLGAYLPVPASQTFRNNMIRFGNVWLGFFAFFTGLLLILHIIRIVSYPLRDPEKRKKRSALTSGFALLLCIFIALSANIYGFAIGNDVWKTNYTVTLDKKVSEHGSVRIALVSDLHFSSNSKPALYKTMVRTINASKPDIVLIAGDFFSGSYDEIRNPDQYAEILKGIHSRDGVYAVYGNHDVESKILCGFNLTPVNKQFRSTEMEQFLKKANINILDDKTVYLDGVQIAGRQDGEVTGTDKRYRSSASKLLSSCDMAMPVIVLEHEPLDFNALRTAGADLVLSGHTHGGQIFPGNLISALMYKNVYGYKPIEGVKSIVTSGVGFYGPPIRIGTHSEVAIIDLKY